MKKADRDLQKAFGRYKLGRLIESGGRQVSHAGLIGAGIYTTSRLLHGHNKEARRFFGHALGQNYGVGPRGRSWIVRHTPGVRRLRELGVKAGKVWGRSKGRLKLTKKVIQVSEKLKVPRWAPKALLYGGLTAFGGSIIKGIASNRIKGLRHGTSPQKTQRQA